MIIDKIENWGFYRYGSIWEGIFRFLQSLTPDSEEKKYEIQGDDVFAGITSYKTASTETTVLEAHRNYVDIQTLLIGREIINTSIRDVLTVQTPYDKTKDVEFYKPSDHLDKIDLYPGIFALFFPQDAHMPGLLWGESSDLVKKVIVKIKIECLTVQ